MAYQIDRSKCISCGTCDVECPFGAVIISSEGKFSISIEKCRNCGICASVCPVDAVGKWAGYKSKKQERPNIAGALYYEMKRCCQGWVDWKNTVIVQLLRSGSSVYQHIYNELFTRRNLVGCAFFTFYRKAVPCGWFEFGANAIRKNAGRYAELSKNFSAFQIESFVVCASHGKCFAWQSTVCTDCTE